jgi:hypothetical protein
MVPASNAGRGAHRCMVPAELPKCAHFHTATRLRISSAYTTPHTCCIGLTLHTSCAARVAEISDSQYFSRAEFISGTSCTNEAGLRLCIIDENLPPPGGLLKVHQIWWFHIPP